MKRRTVVIIAGTLAAVIAGFGIYLTDPSNEEVERLKAEVRKRGMMVEFADLPISEVDIGVDEAAALSVFEIKALTSIKLEEAEIADVRKVVATLEPHFAKVAAFANLGRYAPKRVWKAGMSTQDYADIRLAAKAVYAKGLVQICDGQLEGVISSLKLLNKISQRSLDELPNRGNFAFSFASRYHRRLISRTADRYTGSSTILDQLDNLTRESPTVDRRKGLELLLMDQLAYVDMFERGEVSQEITDLGLVEVDVSRNPRYIGKLRTTIPQMVIDFHDEWDQLEPERSSTFLPENGDFLTHLPNVMRDSAAHARKSDLDEKAEIAALKLKIDAYKSHIKTGKWPTIDELAKSGANTIDPFTKQPFTMTTRNGHVEVLAERHNPRSLTPDATTVVAVLFPPY
ncbi:MAG: hypothetical protein M3R13_11060 [Armatimonadota bacterium]|nr:hypothetical protein [Armatimonadota bacterium]